MAKQAHDSFDKLLIELAKQGFILPFSTRIAEYPLSIKPKDARAVAKADQEAWQKNRNALITAMTNSEWIAQ